MRPAPVGTVVSLRREVDPERLLEALRAGGPRAGALLYDAFADDVNRLVWRLLGADPDHDDIVQTVFVRLLRGAARVREAAALRGWVRAVTVNEVRDELRRRRLRRLFFGAAPDYEDVQAPEVDPERRRLLVATYAALEKLPTDERLAFSLRFLEGHTLPEVAELCGCSLATAKRRLARGRERFERAVGRDPAFRGLLGDAAGEGGDP